MPPLVHLANALFLLSYFVRDILWLRVFAVVASCALLASSLVMHPITWASLAWNGVFVSLNVFQIKRLLLERRPVALDPEQAALHQQTFRALPPRSFLRLVRTGEFRDAGPGQQLIAQGEALDGLLVLARGAVSVRVDGREVARLAPGQLIGEMSFLTGRPTTASVVAVTSSRYLRLPRPGLHRLFDREPDIRVAVQMVIGHDLVAKVKPGAPAPAAAAPG